MGCIPGVVQLLLVLLTEFYRSTQTSSPLELAAMFQGIQLAHLKADGGRRITAAQPVPSGGCFLEVPQELLLTADLARNLKYPLASVFASMLTTAAGLDDDRLILVLVLLMERARGRHSKWAAYISILPVTFSMQSLTLYPHPCHMPRLKVKVMCCRTDDPCWWAPEDLALVKRTRLAHCAGQYRGSLQYLTHWRDRLLDLCRHVTLACLHCGLSSARTNSPPAPGSHLSCAAPRT